MNLRGNTINKVFKRENFDSHQQDYEPIEFCEYGFDMLESETLTNNVYTFFIDMMAHRFEGHEHQKGELHISDVGLFYQTGVYIPCVNRVAFTREVDLLNDGLPDLMVAANIDRNEPDDYTTAFMVRPVTKIPRHVLLPPRCVKKYKLVVMCADKQNKMELGYLYFGINKHGHILPPIEKWGGNSALIQAEAQIYPSLTINACADSKYLWLAKCEENISTHVDLKLLLGLSPEHIKSLFYARTLPLTETGRKRPILHWVRAHKRRIKEGIEIDISTYLRGISHVSLDGLDFEIIQPTKPNVGSAKILSLH